MNQASNKPFFILLGFALLLFFLFVFVVFMSFSASQNASPKTTPLTEKEKAYSEAVPQPFRGEKEKTGTLIVTSDLQGVEVTVDPSEEDAGVSKLQLPTQHIPFKVTTIPVGTHVILAYKEGFIDMESTVVIRENEVTRLHVVLNRLETVD